MNKKSKVDVSRVEFKRWFTEREDPDEEAKRLRGLDRLIGAIFGEEDDPRDEA